MGSVSNALRPKTTRELVHRYRMQARGFAPLSRRSTYLALERRGLALHGRGLTDLGQRVARNALRLAGYTTEGGLSARGAEILPRCEIAVEYDVDGVLVATRRTDLTDAADPSRGR